MSARGPQKINSRKSSNSDQAGKPRRLVEIMYRFPRTANEQPEHRQSAQENRPQEPSPPNHVENHKILPKAILETQNMYPCRTKHCARHQSANRNCQIQGAHNVISRFHVRRQGRQLMDDCAHLSIQRDSRHAREQDSRLQDPSSPSRRKREKLRHKLQELTQTMYPLSHQARRPGPLPMSHGDGQMA